MQQHPRYRDLHALHQVLAEFAEAARCALELSHAYEECNCSPAAGDLRILAAPPQTRRDRLHAGRVRGAGGGACSLVAVLKTRLTRESFRAQSWTRTPARSVMPAPARVPPEIASHTGRCASAEGPAGGPSPFATVPEQNVCRALRAAARAGWVQRRTCTVADGKMAVMTSDTRAMASDREVRSTAVGSRKRQNSAISAVARGLQAGKRPGRQSDRLTDSNALCMSSSAASEKDAFDRLCY